MTYSVLMSVYHKESLENLKISLCSILNQTIESNNIVVVEDGPLNKQMSLYLNNMKDKYPQIVLVKLSENVGLSRALNEGLKYCNNEIIMRMDSDDYSEINRAEKLLESFEEFRDVDCIGSHVVEFRDNVDNIIFKKEVPLNHDSIVKKMKRRNSINHPSVAYKKTAIEDVGGYKDLPFNEDYYLWVRMILRGHKFLNIDDYLVRMRVNNNFYDRRKGKSYYENQKKLFEYMRGEGFITKQEYNYNVMIRYITKVLLPSNLNKFIYQNMLRKRWKK